MTEIYLTEEQRRRLDSLRRSRGESLAELIRVAVDDFLDREGLGPDASLEQTFGVVPDAAVPDRGEWPGRTPASPS